MLTCSLYLSLFFFSDLLPIFKLDYFLTVRFQEVFVYFGYGPLPGMDFGNVLSQSVACIFILFTMSFADTLNFNEAKLMTFFSWVIAFGVVFKNLLLNPRSCLLCLLNFESIL